MSYQIKSTPFFRRMFNTSKKNGQLQRLREEYERIQEFNDRTIELKMRQVRLKRLFREIEEIKESNTPAVKRRRLPGEREKSLQAMRVEAIVKSKQLGKELSKRNAELMEHATYSRFDISPTIKRRAAADAKRQETERKERTAKRINYGNAISKCNIKKIAQRREKVTTRVKAGGLNPQKQVDVKKDRLKQRLEYGNARSNCNMTRNGKRNQDSRSKSSGIQLGRGGSTLASHDSQDPKALCRKQTLILRTSESSVMSEETYSAVLMHQREIMRNGPRVRAQEHWHTVSLTLPWFGVIKRREFYKMGQENMSPVIKYMANVNDAIVTDESSGGEDQPPSSRTWQGKRQIRAVGNDESIQSDQTINPAKAILPLVSVAERKEEFQANDNKDIAKLFQPVVREVTQKHASESVKKLRQIFEH